MQCPHGEGLIRLNDRNGSNWATDAFAAVEVSGNSMSGLAPALTTSNIRPTSGVSSYWDGYGTN